MFLEGKASRGSRYEIITENSEGIRFLINNPGTSLQMTNADMASSASAARAFISDSRVVADEQSRRASGPDLGVLASWIKMGIALIMVSSEVSRNLALGVVSSLGKLISVLSARVAQENAKEASMVLAGASADLKSIRARVSRDHLLSGEVARLSDACRGASFRQASHAAAAEAIASVEDDA